MQGGRYLDLEETVVCLSCKRDEARSRAVSECHTDTILCESCFLSWVQLYLEGYVRNFSDIIPHSEAVV